MCLSIKAFSSLTSPNYCSNNTIDYNIKCETMKLVSKSYVFYIDYIYYIPYSLSLYIYTYQIKATYITMHFADI